VFGVPYFYQRKNAFFFSLRHVCQTWS
jgi:hypothetical protein